ncbi:TGF-beta-activated kinase 1 and MAP3K7-binding protein 1-like isoform X2 [Artemia franciscana]
MFDGHEGSHVSEFASQKMPAEILLGQLKESSSSAEVKEVLKQAFTLVERGYFESLDDILAQRADLQGKLPEGTSDYDAMKEYPEIVAQLSDLNRRVGAGSTAIVSLIFKERLYAAGVGNGRILICRTDDYGQIHVEELLPKHDVINEKELIRLGELDIDRENASTGLRLLCQGNTRCIGNYLVKGGYKECEHLSAATSEPVIHDPTIVGDVPVDESCRFMLIMTDGLVKAVEEVSDTKDPNMEIVQLTIKQFNTQSTIMGVAQAVIDQIVRCHHERFLSEEPLSRKFNGHGDMTLLVRNFTYPMPNALLRNVTRSVESSSRQLISPSSTISSQKSVVVKDSSSCDLDCSCDTLTHLATSSSTDSSEMQIRRGNQLPLNADGKIAPYVNFSGYYKSVEDARRKGLLSKGIDYYYEASFFDL